MTAEVAILNPSGIALAADSAVTIKGRQSQKIFNTANKLFNLNKYHPIGIMFYQNASFMGLPWETIIKVYRTHIKEEICDTVEKQSMDLIHFIENNYEIFPRDVRDEWDIGRVQSLFAYLKKSIEDEIMSQFGVRKQLEQDEIEKIVEKVIIDELGAFEKKPFLKDFGNKDCNDFVKLHNDKIDKKIEEVFEKLPLSDVARNGLKRFSSIILCKDYFPDNTKTGMVIGGFGKKQFWPSLIEFEVDYLVGDKLRYKMLNNFEHYKGALIRPYAQEDMVHAFMQGIHPFLDTTIDTGLKKAAKDIINDLKVFPEMNALLKLIRINL